MDKIIETAQTIHRMLWKMTGDTSMGTKMAIAVTKEWQKQISAFRDPSIHIEYSVGGGLGEKIDAVDLGSRQAYEMKVSPNNTHFEFYRDIFKILAHNEANPHRPFDSLVFITPSESATKVSTGLGATAIAAAKKLGLNVVVHGI